MTDVPKLPCPECSTPLIPATGRGLHDEDGEFLEHREECECPYCGPMWSDSTAPVTCECGALVKVTVDDDHAYATEVDP